MRAPPKVVTTSVPPHAQRRARDSEKAYTASRSSGADLPQVDAEVLVLVAAGDDHRAPGRRREPVAAGVLDGRRHAAAQLIGGAEPQVADLG